MLEVVLVVVVYDMMSNPIQELVKLIWMCCDANGWNGKSLFIFMQLQSVP